MNTVLAELKKSHLIEQAWRAARLFAIALIAQVALIPNGHMSRTALVAAAVAAVEVVYREVFRVAMMRFVAQLLPSGDNGAAPNPPAVQ